jgi:hypothetical protein
MPKMRNFKNRVLGPEHPDTLGSVNHLAGLLESQGDYAGALYRRALEGLVKISAAMKRAHPNLQTFLDNYAGCLEQLGRSPPEIRRTVEALMRPYGTSLGRGEAEQTGSKPSPRLRAVIERVMRDPSKLQEIVEQLQREDPELFMELVQSVQRQQ